jgi:hypothetical protein
MTDDELLARFETGAIDPGAFRHRDHLRVAWVCLRRHGRRDTERRLLAALQALAARAGKPDKFSAPLTLAWVARIASATAALPADHSFDDLLLYHPGLLDRAAVSQAPHTI